MCDFSIVMRDGNINYIFVYRFQALNPHSIEYLWFIVMGKPIRNAYLGMVKQDWTSIVCERANRKPFLFARGNI